MVLDVVASSSRGNNEPANRCCKSSRIGPTENLDNLDDTAEKSKNFELPEPPAVIETYRNKLADNTFQVLVVGEAKRGKSTFVNALIGRDILPTDVDIATSQVFRICQANQEAYRLRFEDDSQQTITAAELPRYGSQVAADVEGMPRLDQIIRWIEVDVPVRFLPANVRILDTPGLGALYAAHAQITHRFVPHADAVIFVLDSQAPIGKPEIQFLETILGVTRSRSFIQTKIDQFRREAWQEIQKRNQEILTQQFQGRLTDMRVWPISSTNLQKAAQTGDDDYLMVSRHKELAAGLQAFLFRVSGWSRSAEAVLLAGHYQSQSRSILNGRLDNLLEESKQKTAASQRGLPSNADSSNQTGVNVDRSGASCWIAFKDLSSRQEEFRQILQPAALLKRLSEKTSIHCNPWTMPGDTERHLGR